MSRTILILAVFSILAHFSCSSMNSQPEIDKSILVFYVEEFHKPISKPKVNLHIAGLEKPLRLALKAPAAVVRTIPAEVLNATGWTAAKGMTISGQDSFEFTAPAGKISLAPYKIQIISKSQIVVKPLTYLDLEYAKGRFAQNEDFAELDILYPEILPE